MGKVRHVADIRADDISQDSNGFVQLQSGTNKFASQKGMSLGKVRHIADIRADDLSREGMDYVSLQSGLSALLVDWCSVALLWFPVCVWPGA